jgi:intraflagellar transport protein 20
MDDGKLVTFDDDVRIRILDADKHAASTRLRNNCSTFNDKVEELQSLSDKYVNVLEKVASRIEDEKLRAVGLRNRVAALQAERDQHKKELGRQIAEKQQILESYELEERSLAMVIEEQETQMARLKGTSVY